MLIGEEREKKMGINERKLEVITGVCLQTKERDSTGTVLGQVREGCSAGERDGTEVGLYCIGNR